MKRSASWWFTEAVRAMVFVGSVVAIWAGVVLW